MELTNKKMEVVYGDVTLGVYCEKFSAIFSYQAGGLESLVIGGKEWIYRAPKPTFWRALTDNDRGSKFHIKSGQWHAADLYIQCKNIRISMDGESIEDYLAPSNNRFQAKVSANIIEICYTYETITSPSTLVDVTYKVSCEGFKIEFYYHGQKGLPELPVVGMRFVIPTCATRVKYEGLSGETYPDRMMGGVPGVYELEGLPVTPYLVPQDCGMHMDTKWIEVYRNRTKNNTDHDNQEFKLRMDAIDQKIHFSCLPYTAQELESATHHEELPIPRKTVLCVYAGVRGVGGIDSWGTDVEEPYRVSAEMDHKMEFMISI